MSESYVDQPQVFLPADVFRRPDEDVVFRADAISVHGIPDTELDPDGHIEDQIVTDFIKSFRTDHVDESATDIAVTTEATTVDLSAEDEQVDADSISEKERSRWQKVLHVGKRAVETGVMVFEFSPFNEGARYGAAAIAFAITHNPLASAGTIGVATFAMEGLCSLAAADLLSSDVAARWIEKINAFAEKRGIPREAKLNGALKSAVAYLGGAAVIQAFKKREVPEQTKAESRVYGLKAAAALSGVVATQTYLATNGIAHPEPGTIAGAVLGVGSIFGVYGWSKRRLKAENTDENSNTQIEVSNE